MNSHEVFIHIHQGCFAGTWAIVRLPRCQWSKPDGYGIFSQCITTTQHSKAKTVCIFLGIYCTHEVAPWHAENRSEIGYWHKVLSLVPAGPGHAKLWERPQEANVTSITPSVQFKMAVVGRLSPQIALRESRKYNTVTSHDDAKNYRKSTCLFKSLLKLTDHPTTPTPHSTAYMRQWIRSVLV